MIVSINKRNIFNIQSDFDNMIYLIYILIKRNQVKFIILKIEELIKTYWNIFCIYLKNNIGIYTTII